MAICYAKTSPNNTYKPGRVYFLFYIEKYIFIYIFFKFSILLNED